MSGPKYDIEVQLTGKDGNAFAIIGFGPAGAQAPMGARPKRSRRSLTRQLAAIMTSCSKSACEWVEVADNA